MERIEAESEVHRFQKAIKRQLGISNVEGDILFADSKVHISVPEHILRTVGGQRVLALMVNLLARMKTAVSEVTIYVPDDVALHPYIPLNGKTLRAGLSDLARSISGDNSSYSVGFDFDGNVAQATIAVAIGCESNIQTSANIGVWANAWTAFINASSPRPDWNTDIPFGSHIAATLAVAEIFKHLLIQNFPDKARELQIKLLGNTEFCSLTYSSETDVEIYPMLGQSFSLDNVAIAGVGAGGSAVLYSLACLPQLTGNIVLIDHGQHKKSNLNRYLLSTYDDCHTGTNKAQNAHKFLIKYHPLLRIREEACRYEDVENRDFRFVVSTVDTIDVRWIIQRDMPSIILDAAVVDAIYAVLRVYPNQGMCLGCKHPYDPELAWKRRAHIWGTTLERVREMELRAIPLSESDIERLAKVQNQPVEKFVSLIGIPFNEIPSITECGDTQFNLSVPNQTASIPFVTTMAGILIAAEIVKEQIAPDLTLSNWFDHNMFWLPKSNRHRFRKQLDTCHICSKTK